MIAQSRYADQLPDGSSGRCYWGPSNPVGRLQQTAIIEYIQCVVVRANAFIRFGSQRYIGRKLCPRATVVCGCRANCRICTVFAENKYASVGRYSPHCRKTSEQCAGSNLLPFKHIRLFFVHVYHNGIFAILPLRIAINSKLTWLRKVC